MKRRKQRSFSLNGSFIIPICLLLILPVSLTALLTSYVRAHEHEPARAAVEVVSLPDEQRITHYDIFVRLDESQKVLDASQQLLWQYPGEQPVHELYFHLYPNAFESKRTTFMRESGGKLREDKATDESLGKMDLSKLSVNGVDLLEQAEYVQPDDGNEHDKTVLKVMLPEPLGKGDTAHIDIHFSVQLPYVFARMGHAGEFIMAGQWFPKIGVYETKGMRGRTTEGWNIHQYHGNSEFYSNFGSYRVKIDVPSDYIVAATGVRQHKRHMDGRTLHEFAADAVHDFAWSASPSFIESASSVELPNGEYVKVQLYLDPLHEHLEARYMRAAKQSLVTFSEWFGPYPYPTLSVVVPPASAGGAAGMEYPTLITAWAADEQAPGLALERVVAHEIGHQYFYGLLASNEFEEAWLDEAFTSYAEDRLMKKVYQQVPFPGLEAVYVTDPAPLHWNAWDYNDHDHYAENVYIRGKLVLREIEKRIGAEKMEDVLRDYVMSFQLGHPTTTDFKNVLERVTQEDWDAFFNTFVYEPGMTDYALTRIDTEERSETELLRHTLYIEKLGASATRLPLMVHYADGSREVHFADGTHDNIKLTIEHSSDIAWAVIDPYFSLTLEHVRINNFLRNNLSKNDQAKWNLAAVQIIEAILQPFAW